MSAVNRDSLIQGTLINLREGVPEEYFQRLESFYEHLQVVCVDTDPYEDIYAFASRAVYFAAIIERPKSGFQVESPPPPVEQHWTPPQSWNQSHSNVAPDPTPSPWRTIGGQPFSPYSGNIPQGRWLLANEILSNPPSLRGTPRAPHPLPRARRDPPPPPPVVGIIYFTLTPSHSIPILGVGELSIGIYIPETHRRRGYAKESISLALQHGFQRLNAHRIQALLIGSGSGSGVGIPLGLFLGSGFGHEGIRRRAYYSPVEQEWKDVTCLAILATDWINRAYRGKGNNSAPVTLWDEMLARHQREREALLKWDETQRAGAGGVVKRSASMETIRCLTEASDTDSVMSGSEEPPMKTEEGDDPFADSPSEKGKRKLDDDDEGEGEEGETLTHWEMSDADDADIPPSPSNSPTKRRRNLDLDMDMEDPPSPTLSQYSTASSVPTTISEISLSDESQWERLDGSVSLGEERLVESRASLGEGWSSNDESDWEQERDTQTQRGVAL